MSGSVRSFDVDDGRSAGATPGARARAPDRLRLLAEAIEAEIVPLLVRQRDAPCAVAAAETPQNARRRLQAWTDQAQRGRAARALDDEAINLRFAPLSQAAIDLAALVLSESGAAIVSAVADAVARQGLESVCLDLLAPAARHLGALWSEDICSFTDVTIGLMHLQSALLAVTMPMTGTAGAAGAAGAVSVRRSILLAPAPGDQHTFGLTMVAGFLERAGWSVTQLSEGGAGVIEAALRGGWFGVVGLSAGSAGKLESVQRLLPRLRAVSRNPDLGIMVGGPLCVADPGLAGAIGADGTAADGAQAVALAEALVAPRRTKRRMAIG